MKSQSGVTAAAPDGTALGRFQIMNSWACRGLIKSLIWVSLIIVLWTVVAPNWLYHCWDDGIAFWPPFIHPWANTPDGKLRDFYRAPEWVVFGCWGIWLVATAGGVAVSFWKSKAAQSARTPRR